MLPTREDTDGGAPTPGRGSVHPISVLVVTKNPKWARGRGAAGQRCHWPLCDGSAQVKPFRLQLGERLAADLVRGAVRGVDRVVVNLRAIVLSSSGKACAIKVVPAMTSYSELRSHVSMKQ